MFHFCTMILHTYLLELYNNNVEKWVTFYDQHLFIFGIIKFFYNVTVNK